MTNIFIVYMSLSDAFHLLDNLDTVKVLTLW